MLKKVRVIVPGFPDDVVQRGHNRQPVSVECLDSITTWHTFLSRRRSLNWTTGTGLLSRLFG